MNAPRYQVRARILDNATFYSIYDLDTDKQVTSSLTDKEAVYMHCDRMNLEAMS